MEFKVLDANGIKIRTAIEGEGPLVLMVHGWPESWYSWRHQTVSYTHLTLPTNA